MYTFVSIKTKSLNKLGSWEKPPLTANYRICYNYNPFTSNLQGRDPGVRDICNVMVLDPFTLREPRPWDRLNET